MSALKKILFPLGCIVANFVLIAGDCQNVKEIGPIQFEKIEGTWHVLYTSKPIVDFLRNIKDNITIAKNEARMDVTAVFFSFPVKFQANFKIPENHSSKVVVQVNPLYFLSETYTVHSDYNCYLIGYGCLNILKIDSSVIAFRDKHPTKECEDSAKAAYKNAGFDLGRIAKDPTIAA